MQNVSVTPLTTAIGARVDGIDLTQPLADDDAEFIRAALAEHSVLVFKNQDLNDEHQMAVASIFGPLESAPSRQLFGFNDPVRVIELPVFSCLDDGAIPYGSRKTEYRWHVDDGFCEKIPNVATLRPVSLPAAGGDTYWTNMASVFESFSPGMQAWLETLSGINAAPPNFRATVGFFDLPQESQTRFNEEEAVRAHPIVVRHPVTGRKSLFVSPTYTVEIEGFSSRESTMLLNFLFAEANRPDFVYRHHWEMGDLVIWDELPTLHQGPDSLAPDRQLVRIYGGLTKPMPAKLSA